jgi:ribosomal protein S17E
MEELLELHDAITQHRYEDALEIVDEMTAMAKKEIITKIGSYIRVLLIHLIKSHVEQRMTHSWSTSILLALEAIQRYNQREESDGKYLDAVGLAARINEYWELALRKASLESFDGKYSPREFAKLVDADIVKAQALDYILNGYPESED